MQTTMGQKLIDPKQLFVMLVVSRMAALTAFSPDGGAVEGTAVLLSQLPSLLMQLFVLLPAWMVVGRWGGSDILDCIACQNPAIGKICALLAWVFCIYQTATTLFMQALFQTTTLYPQASPLPLMLALLVGAGYMVYLGLEATARLSLWTLCLFLILLVAIATASFHLINPANLRSPLANGAWEVVWAGGRTALQSPELGAAVLLIPTVRGKAGRHSAAACVVWTLLLAGITFLTLTVLGNFAATRPYPMYAMSAIGGGPLSSHMEAFYTAAWVFLALIRATLFLWLGMRCLNVVFRGVKRTFLVNIFATGGLAMIIAMYAPMREIFWPTAILIMTVVLLLPTVAMMVGKGFVREENRYGKS